MNQLHHLLMKTNEGVLGKQNTSERMTQRTYNDVSYVSSRLEERVAKASGLVQIQLQSPLTLPVIFDDILGFGLAGPRGGSHLRRFAFLSLFFVKGVFFEVESEDSGVTAGTALRWSVVRLGVVGGCPFGIKGIGREG